MLKKLRLGLFALFMVLLQLFIILKNCFLRLNLTFYFPIQNMKRLMFTVFNEDWATNSHQINVKNHKYKAIINNNY